jgi:hypothetical protein
MNCDQVFDILTRGPFPSGAASDASVQRHLGACAECRQLAEALRPALDLIHESVPPEESWGLPGYWEDVPPGERPVTVKQRPQLAVRRMHLPTEAKRRRSSRSEQTRLILIAAFAGAFAAVAVVGAQRVIDHTPRASSATPVSTASRTSGWPDQCGCPLVATDAKLEQFTINRDLRSCSECHDQVRERWQFDEVQWKPAASRELAMACVACHDIKPRD